MTKLHIGLLEDEPQSQKQFESTLRDWHSITKQDYFLQTFSCCSDLLSYEIHKLDIIFLDIALSNKDNGIEAAKTIRNLHYHGQIVFLTSYHEYVFKGYEVHALNYYLKPITLEHLSSCLCFVSDNLEKKYYLYSQKGMTQKIPFQDILCFSGYLHNIRILTNENSYVQRIPFHDLHKYGLPDYFVQCHRSEIVNLYHIQNLTRTEIVLSNQLHIAVSSTYAHSVRENFLRLFN